MPIELTFFGWQRPAIYDLVDGVEGARARVRLATQARSLAPDGEVNRTTTARLTVRTAGPGDVRALAPDAITGRYPTPGAPDAETPLCPHVEFADPTLPWRYTPAGNPRADDLSLRPWLALVVGTDDEVELAGETATIGAAALREHPLRQSPTWAHVQELDGHRLARLLCRRLLQPRVTYHALLVPTFVVGGDGELANAWAASPPGPVTLPVYARWRFRTGPGGDFRTLADALEPGAADASTGLTTVRYPRLPDQPVLSVGGALTAVDPPADVPPQAIRDDVDLLRGRPTDGIGRRILGLPTYGGAWKDQPDETAWGGPLNTDPRHRGIAGLGSELGVVLQEELAERVAQQAGAQDAAEERIRHLTLGLAASEALWRRRLPTDPARRVWLFGPALRRVVTAAGPVADRATADDRPLPRGWFSPAARRTLRRGPARVALAHPAAADPAPLNQVANRPPTRPSFADPGLPSFGRLGAAEFDRERAEAAESQRVDAGAVAHAFGSLDMSRFRSHTDDLLEVRDSLQLRRSRRELPWVRLTLLLTALADGEDDPGFDAATVGDLLPGLAADLDEQNDDADVLPALLRELGDDEDPPPLFRPVDLGGLGTELAAAFDPTGIAAPARRRVLSTLTGLDPARPLEPPEQCPRLDLPVWRRLADRAPDWLLPGIGQLGEDVVLALGTNPAFVDAFLIGLNTRLLEELRWRNLRIATGCTPIRAFWLRTDESTGDRLDDIAGIADWADDSSLGHILPRPPGATESDLVLVFRTRLFQRYPHTLLYLVSDSSGFTEPPDDDAPRTLPTFQGRIGEDVTFFGFVGVRPQAVTGLWIALEEPPSGFRFRNDQPATGVDDGAQFAHVAFDDPTRVLIRGDHLVPGASS
ncbi:hypothetical protein [Cryptosporangium minutisporangium]|uniref:Uncharacterized protein n=1 Tax=Cryptosporangium minutisporangium TaxID=113569 RepID=A0ABP6SYM1_9ACTN